MSRIWPAPEHPTCQEQVLRELKALAAENRPGCFNSILSPADLKIDGKLPYRQRIRRQLAKSEVAQLLASGPDRAVAIYDHTPAWAHLFLGPRPRNIRDTTRLVALNLDWYLDHPRPLLRQTWINLSLTALALLACTLIIILVQTSVLTIGPHYFLAWLATVVIWISLQGDYRRSLWVNELHDYLYEVYTGHPPGSDEESGADSGHNDNDAKDRRRE